MANVHRRQLPPGQRLRALVVDDSAVLRHLVVRTLQQDPCIDVVASAPNGAVALEQISQFRPDVVSLDLEMPEMDGIETLRRIRKHFPATRVVIFSSYTERGASATLEALTLGADDYVTKSRTDDLAISLRDSLIPKIKQFFVFAPEQRAGEVTAVRLPTADPSENETQRNSFVRPKVVLIGVSTGGPEALSAVLPAVPADFDLPILIVQHMPPLFTRFLSDRLAESVRLPVREATHGEKLNEAKILIAPGDYHLRLAAAGPGQGLEVRLDQRSPENSCRPSVDVLFSSAAEVLGSAVLAIVMTGMGQDGMRGACSIRSQGGFVMVQDEATSAVWGMPGAVYNAGQADLVLPLAEIIPEMVARAGWTTRKGCSNRKSDKEVKA